MAGLPGEGEPGRGRVAAVAGGAAAAAAHAPAAASVQDRACTGENLAASEKYQVWQISKTVGHYGKFRLPSVLCFFTHIAGSRILLNFCRAGRGSTAS
jgi:hypothetical protein